MLCIRMCFSVIYVVDEWIKKQQQVFEGWMVMFSFSSLFKC